MRATIAAIGFLVSVSGPVGAAQFDGTYVGDRIAADNHPACPSGEKGVTWRVTGNRVFKKWTGLYEKLPPIDVPIAPDGSFKSVTDFHEIAGGGMFVRTITFSGRIVGDTFDAELIDQYCKYTYHLTRVQ